MAINPVRSLPVRTYSFYNILESENKRKIRQKVKKKFQKKGGKDRNEKGLVVFSSVLVD
jgi:hypothetical protein